MANGKRLLFFDLLRIVSIAMIVFYHLALVLRWAPFYMAPTIFNIAYLNCGIIGAYLMVFVSGSVLEYAHTNLGGFRDITRFYAKRLVRIYPAFWMSMVIGLAFTSALLSRPAFTTIMEFSGFNTWTGHWGGLINSCGWFIGLIVALYFFFPFLSASIRKYPVLTLVLIAFVEIFLRYTLITHSVPGFDSRAARWLPFCNFLEFGLGIWIVQNGLYPKWTYDNRLIGFLADISFYVFLVHLVSGMKEALIPASLPLYFVAVALLAWLLMVGDQKVQGWLKKRVCWLYLREDDHHGADVVSVRAIQTPHANLCRGCQGELERIR